jgi:hypothetical protein
MKRGSTLFLRTAVVILGLGVFGLCIIMFVGLDGEGIRNVPYLERFLTPLVLMTYLSAIPFYIALFQAFKLLNYIDKNSAFSELSTKALRNIKYCAFTITVLYIAALPDFFRLAEADDAPGVVIIGLIFVGAACTIAIFAAVLEKLVESAMTIKSENDLTV